MKVAVNELVNFLTQPIFITQRKGLYSPVFALWLYMHNSPSGEFDVTITNTSGFLQKKSFTCDDVKNQLQTTDNYAHVFYRVNFDNVCFPSGEYEIKLSSEDHVYNESSYIGWCKDWDNDFEGTNIEPWYSSPFCVRIFNQENREN